MQEEAGHFDGLNGLQLFFQAWLPDGPPKAILAIAHGAGEHIGRYQNLVDGLVPAGFLVAGFDQRGHGRSEGRRGHVDSWDEYRQDIRTFLSLASQFATDVPLFLYGHSQGSLAVLDYILRDPQGLCGAISSGTPLDPQDAAPPHLVLLAKALSGVWPTFSRKVPLDGASLSRDPQVAKAYIEDPLVHWWRSARWGTETLNLLEWVRARAAEINLPILFLHGERDRLVSVAGAERFFDQIRFPDKTLLVYPDGLHEPHNDLQRAQVVADIRNWMDRHIQ